MGFSNVKIFGKIMVLALVLLVFLGGTGFYALMAINNVETRYEQLLQQELDTQRLVSEIKLVVVQNGLSALEHVSATDPSRQAIFEEELEVQGAYLGNLVEEYLAMDLTGEEIEAFDDFERMLISYQDNLEEAIMYSKAREPIRAGNAYLASIGKKNLTHIALDKLIDLSQAKSVHLREINNSELTKTRGYVFAALVIALIVSVTMAFVIGRGLSRRLKVLEETARRGAAGDLTMIGQLEGQDELGHLSASFGAMINSLRQVTARVREGAVQTVSVAEELRFGIEETGRAVEQVNSAIQDIAIGANEQAGGAQQASELVNQIYEAIEVNSGRTKEVNERMDQVLDLADQGLEQLDNQNQRMRNNAEASDKVGQAIRELNQMVQEIGQMVDTISQFAEQTNLLALNAAIEAARAGEHGRGFAVVAEEVRKLAEGSSQAAGEIGQIVNRVQIGAQGAVEEMGFAQDAIQAQEEAVVQTDSIFRRISQGIQEVEEGMEEIGVAGGRILERAQGVAQVIQNIASVAEENAAATQEVSASSEEQGATMEELNSLAQSLTQMGQDLLATISHFDRGKEEEEEVPEQEQS